MKKKISLSTTHIILLSFLATILVGTLILTLPISSKTREWTPFVDALFTATTATCVTGLVVVPTFCSWSVFGQAVILLLIQIGGLGVITVTAGIALIINRKMGLFDRVLLMDAFNLNTLSGLSSFVKRVIRGTLLIEGLGAVLYMIRFIPDFGPRGVWISVFTSVSAFCNAGIDIIAADSLCSYATDTLVNCVTMGLIVLGGIGYIVWWDVMRVFGKGSLKQRHFWQRLTLHSKIAIATSLLLLFAGAACYFVFEHNNPATIANMSLPEQIQVSLFQSVSARTAGMATVPQENLTDSSALITLVLMFIGGSPVGTAGGVKTVTVALLLSAAISAIRGKNDVTLFGRTVPKSSISKAIGVFTTSFSIMFISTVLLSAVTDAAVIDLFFETVSAVATVGFSRNLTSSLDVFGKLIITATMYLGRVGPISLAVAFSAKSESPNAIKSPTENVSVG